MIFLRNFLKEISDDKGFHKKSWSLFSDGRIGLMASGTYFFKTRTKENYWGVGLQAGHEFNSNKSPDNNIPFSIRNTRFAVNIYPFIWFFKS